MKDPPPLIKEAVNNLINYKLLLFKTAAAVTSYFLFTCLLICLFIALDGRSLVETV